ncbi:MAG: hypothetical protein GX078_02410, partial [Clostridiales bacterium]|nr:hypothetical protein [Clostridiales bacterium]
MKRILHILIVMTLVFSVGVTVYADEVSDAMDAVDKAEASLLQADVTDAEALVALVPESETKNVLTSRLNAVQSIITNQVAPAEAAVLQAETTLLQADVTSAQPPVDSLPPSAAKTALLLRLSAVQDIINATATAAVATAETSLLQADVNTAQPLVTALTDGTVKTGLQTRLDVVQDLVDAKAL